MESVLLQHLSIGYTHKGQQHVVVADINAAIQRGQLTCLLGRNGVGKSTLLRTLAAFQPPLAGEIVMEGRIIGAYSDKEMSKLIGIVLTEKPQVQNMMVAEMVAMGRSPYTGFWGTLEEEDEQIVQDAIRLTGIESLQERLIQTLSDGERQKVMIAKALAQQTPVLVLDEPTAFLDYPSKVEMMQLLCRLAKEMDKTIVLSTHDIELAAKIATRFLLLSENGLQEVQASEILMSFSF